MPQIIGGDVTATHKYIGVPPRRLRLTADVVKGRRAEDALAMLRFMPSPSAKLVAKAIKSAMANAENNFQMTPSDLQVVNVLINEGPRLKRFRARAHGRASPLVRRSSHITVMLREVV